MAADAFIPEGGTKLQMLPSALMAQRPRCPLHLLIGCWSSATLIGRCRTMSLHFRSAVIRAQALCWYINLAVHTQLSVHSTEDREQAGTFYFIAQETMPISSAIKSLLASIFFSF